MFVTACWCILQEESLAVIGWRLPSMSSQAPER